MIIIIYVLFINVWKLFYITLIDYSNRFVTDRKFDSIDELHAWADEIEIGIDFQFTRASYKQKEGCSRGDLHNRHNVARPGSKSRTCGYKFMIVRSSRK